ncbi:tetratricopeptide repeat protein [Planctomycetota bacterium]
MESDSTFGAEPDHLRRLFEIGLDESNLEEDIPPITQWDILKEKPGGRIGPYTLAHVLGEGGMGIVYKAQQEHPVKREVALKIIKPGMDSKRIIARFEMERKTLSLFDHPNIAHVLDAGTNDNGLPYFVMEYVNGLVLTEHCDRYKLSIEDRLTLFLQVCSAIQYAHQKGIIHRDIKPSNILVSIQNDHSVPKIIDFGVAKAISRPLIEKTLLTEQGQLLGTPEYMSPEQIDMATEDIDTRSDIYSLGVLLYTLLTGTLPFDSDTFRTGGFDHIRQIIRETDPKTPSTRLSNLGEEAKKIARNRRTEVAKLTKKLHKELEWIPLKAMRKERTERYRSASEFAGDIENYLKGAPLIAGPPSKMYRLKKFVRRNRVLVISVAAVMAVLVAGIVVSTSFAIRADRQAKITQTVNDFLNFHILRSFSSYRQGGGEVTVLSVLDAASTKLEGRFKNEPLIEASIRQSLGEMYENYAEFKMAGQHLERALQLWREHLGEKDPKTLSSVMSLGHMLFRLGRYDEAESYLHKAVQSRRVVSGLTNPNTLIAMHHLGLLYMFQGRYHDWESLSLELLQISRQTFDEEHEVAILAISNTGRLYTFQGHYSKAEPLLVEALELSRRTKGEQSAWVQELSGWLGLLYYLQGSYAEAEPLLVKSVEMCRSMRGEEVDLLLLFTNFLGQLYIDQGRYKEAEQLLIEAMKTGSRKLDQEHPHILSSINVLAVLFTKQKRYGEAKELFDEALEARARKLGDDHPDTLETKNDLAVLYKEQGDYAKAEPLLVEAAESRRLKLGDTHPHTKESLNNLIDLYEAWNKPEKTAQWRNALHSEKIPNEP